MSRLPNALATAAPSFCAVAGGPPSIGAIDTPALSRTVNSDAGGRSSAKGCGSGWQAAIKAPSHSARSPRTLIVARRWPRDRTGTTRQTAPDRARPLSHQRDGGEAAPVVALAAQASPAIAEEQILLSRRVVGGTLDRSEPEPLQPQHDIAGQIEQKVTGTRRREE